MRKMISILLLACSLLYFVGCAVVSYTPSTYHPWKKPIRSKNTLDEQDSEEEEREE